MSVNYEEISPGVRDLVREINEDLGFETCDSGDGSNFEAGMSCAIPVRHVFMSFPNKEETDKAVAVLEERYPDAKVCIMDEEDGSRTAESATHYVAIFPDGEGLLVE